MEDSHPLAPIDDSGSNYSHLFKDILDENLESNLKVREESTNQPDKVRHSTPIYQMLERVENKIRAEEHQKRFGFEVSQKREIGIEDRLRNIPLKDDLWVDKYRPQKFTQLITMDSCNLEVLRWVKQWEHSRDLVAGTPKSEVLRRIDDQRRSQPKANRSSNKNEAASKDILDRPERKILLLHGPPGLGKTTLAHVVAQTAGYSVMEINASDERIGNSVITKISSAIEVKASFTSEKRPSMIVIDEIDGAASAGNENNLIKYLVKLATTKTSSSSSSSKKAIPSNDNLSESDEENDQEHAAAFPMPKKAKKANNLGLMLPIICICNDLYVPALRPLRQVAHIMQVKPIGPVQLSLRLKTICDREGLKINTRTLVDLAEIMDSDVRSALNALQFLHRKSLSGNAANFNRELTFGAFKDSVKPPMKIYDSVFHNSSSTNSIKLSSRHNLSSGNGRKYTELLDNIWGSGVEVDKLMNGCFEIYPTVKFFDNSTMDRVNSALELFSSFDLMSNASGHTDNYLSYKLCGLKELFSSPVHSSIKYPKQDFENFQLQSEFKAIAKDYLSSMPAKTRAESGSKDSILLDRIPALLNISLSQFSNIKSSNPQLMRPEDRQKLLKTVNILSDEGIQLRQVKIPDSASYKFVIDPPIDRLNLDHLTSSSGSGSCEISFSKVYSSEAPPDSHVYSLCRLVASEMEIVKIRKQKMKLGPVEAEKAQPKSSSESASTPVKRRAIDISQVTLPKDAKKRVARDFFGRPIAIPEDGIDSSDGGKSTSNLTKSNDSSKIPKMTIWYVQNDGVSNAVRRNIKIGSFLS